MTIPTQTNAQSLAALIASFGASTGQPPVLTPGDVLLALFEAVATQEDFLQALAQTVNNLTRAQTSYGSDLDSWYGQFGFSRLPAVYASGSETFTSLSPAASPVYIPAATLTNGVYSGGAKVQTQDGSIVFQVIPDTTQVAYNATLNAYVLPAGQTSITATIQAMSAGAASNVVAGQLSQLGTNIAGIASVTNSAAISNGLDAESDTAYRARFVQWFSSLAEATETAILAAANDVQQGLQLTLAENVLPTSQSLTTSAATTNSPTLVFASTVGVILQPGVPVIGAGIPPGTWLVSSTATSVTLSASVTVASGTSITFGLGGTFTLYADNGTGSPPSSLLADIYNAVYAVRAFSVQPYVIGPTVITATIAITVHIGAGFVTGTVTEAVNAAIVAMVNTLTNGATLYVSSIEAAALAVSGVVAVQPGTTINGAAADLTSVIGTEIRTSSSSVTVGTY